MARKRRRGRGEGGIRYRADKELWAATISLGKNGAGKRLRRTVYGKSKTEVQEKLRALQNAAASGIQADAGTLTVGEYLDRWLETSAKRSVRDGTWTRYEQLIRLRIKPHLGSVRLGKLALLNVETWLTEMEKTGIGARGQQMALNVLGRALKDAVRQRLIPYNPVRDATKPKPPKPEMRVWDREQAASFLNLAKEDRLYALYTLALATGMRSGELFGLEWEDIDWETNSLMVQRSLQEVKGRLQIKEVKSKKSRRRIDLPPFAVVALKEHLVRMEAEGHGSKTIFCDSEGKWLRRPNVAQRSFQPKMARAGLPRIRFHDLRHTAATLLLLANVHPKIVSERLGHATIELTLNTYSHLLPTMQRDAAERLEAMFGANGSTMAVQQTEAQSLELTQTPENTRVAS